MRNIIVFIVSVVCVNCEAFLSESCYDAIEDRVNQYAREMNGNDMEDNYDWIVEKLIAAKHESDKSPKFHMNINEVMNYWDREQAAKDELVRGANQQQIIIPEHNNPTMKESFVTRINNFLDRFMANFIRFFDNIKKMINTYSSDDRSLGQAEINHHD